MSRTITVKGVSRISVKPDYIMITLFPEAQAMDYGTTMEIASKQLNELNTVAEQAGFAPGSVKAVNFHIRSIYENVQEKNGTYKRVFNGYQCRQELKLAFDFDTKRLAQVLGTLDACQSKPELHILFTVKDREAMKEELLRKITENARGKARVLCQASGVRLGRLMTIDYNPDGADMSFARAYEAGEGVMPLISTGGFAADMEPEEIDVEDSATFVWEIGE